MATKGESFRTEAQRTGRKAPEVGRPRLSTGVDTSLPGVSATDKRIGRGSTEKRNKAEHAGRKATFVLEDSASGTPSRKSTRKSAHRVKPDSNLKRRQTRATRSPKARAAKAKARAK